ncbi:MAG: GNAT family protein [Eubacteriales bacterium]|nr:GNAT family protein [Eubacteriales bacterium]
MDILLREWKKEDISNVAYYADNKRIADNLRNVFPYPYTEQDARGYVESCIAGNDQEQITRAIVSEGHAVGSIGLFKGTDVYEKSAELGYWLAEDYWGRGIMSEAVRRICAQGFRQWDIVRIYAEPFAYNTGSRKVLEKSGFVLEGILKNSVFKNGKIIDSCIYALIK